MIDRLSELGVRPVLLTGDHENAARAIADSLHISELHANCLPQDKLTHIGEYQSAGAPVCMDQLHYFNPRAPRGARPRGNTA